MQKLLAADLVYWIHHAHQPEPCIDETKRCRKSRQQASIVWMVLSLVRLGLSVQPMREGMTWTRNMMEFFPWESTFSGSSVQELLSCSSNQRTEVAIQSFHPCSLSNLDSSGQLRGRPKTLGIAGDEGFFESTLNRRAVDAES